ncbi:MAG: pseudouridine synthase, partial [bacterium]
MRTSTVGSNEHHLTFEKYFARHFAKSTTEPLAAALAAGHFLCNGIALRNASELLKAGDEIVALEADEIHKPKPQILQIVYEDDDILIVDKPYGMLSHPEAGMREKDVLSELRKSRDAASYAPVNRLDYNTCGLMIVSKNRAAAYQL